MANECSRGRPAGGPLQDPAKRAERQGGWEGAVCFSPAASLPDPAKRAERQGGWEGAVCSSTAPSHPPGWRNWSYAPDLKSGGLRAVWVRVPAPALLGETLGLRPRQRGEPCQPVRLVSAGSGVVGRGLTTDLAQPMHQCVEECAHGVTFGIASQFPDPLIGLQPPVPVCLHLTIRPGAQ